jgi:hypothetical protein
MNFEDLFYIGVLIEATFNLSRKWVVCSMLGKEQKKAKFILKTRSGYQNGLN